MKIRTDFVTNSSSSSFCSISIESADLARLFSNLLDWIREAGEEPYILFDWCEIKGDMVRIEQREGTFFVPPHSLEGIPKALGLHLQESLELSVLRDEPIDALEELSSRADEITSSIVSASWRYGKNVWGEFECEVPPSKSDSYSATLEYDARTGKQTYSEGWESWPTE